MVKPAIAQRKVPRQRRSRVTVDAIIEATLQILAKGGVAALNTTRAAERAGVSVGTLYQYFPTREALLEAALKRQIALVLDVLRRAADESRGAPLEDRLRAVLGALLELKRREPRLFRAFSTELPRIEGMSTKQELTRPATELLLTMLREDAGGAQGRLPSQAAVATVVHAVEGASTRALEDPKLLASSEFAETLVAMALGGLRRQSEPPSCTLVVR